MEQKKKKLKKKNPSDALQTQVTKQSQKCIADLLSKYAMNLKVSKYTTAVVIFKYFR
uniref:Uncharacterized protein n=1 Tax=Nelumbo nucifera TaxID=4432 RepID=A0A823A2K8_NELNU|nr:TPA_asm: hypothetical protein HUJ06_018265 [Nelumbo nucifera]